MKGSPMTDDQKAKLRENAAILYKMASAWVMGLAGTLGTVWLALPVDQQQTIIKLSPLPVWAYPIVLTALGILARIWPQKNITPTEAVGKAA